jgi:RNA polymerase sigma-70 factor (ECF subfamily)
MAAVLVLDIGQPVIRVRWRGNSRSASASSASAASASAATGAAAELDSASALPDDAELVEQSRADAEAFGALYDRYCDRIYRYVYRRLSDHEAAEDVTAEIFLKALKAIDSYRPATAPFSAWLYRIAANAVIDHARAKRVTMSLDVAMDTADVAAPVDEQAINRAEAARVWEAIDQLSEAQRTAVTLRYRRDLPIADIAGQMGRSEGAVKLLLNRGLAAVRVQLDTPAGGLEDQS